MDYSITLSKEFSIAQNYCANIISLIDEGNTLPFIARYRKEMTGTIDDQVLRDMSDRLTYLRNLEKRKADVAQAISSQDKMTPEILANLDRALTLAVVEDIYRPFKPKKMTRAKIAAEMGLKPLADEIMKQELTPAALNKVAEAYVNPDKGVPSVEKALSGAEDIIAETVSDDPVVRQNTREVVAISGRLNIVFNEKELKRVASLKDEEAKKGEKTKFATYEMYREYSERIADMPAHRILAVNRGEAEDCLKVTLEHDEEAAIARVKPRYVRSGSPLDGVLTDAITDSYSRLIFPSLEREARAALTDRANEQAIKMFEVNLKPLLMQPPLKGARILGLDPAYRTGCKIAVIDEHGNVLDTAVVYPTPPQSRVEEAAEKLLQLIKKHKVTVISIGNGTASKESEIFVASLLPRCPHKVSYAVVNEAGASVYSASKLGAEEFPEYDVSLRSAVSIARRLQDPLAELIKIDVKSIGVGQYQHDMPQNRLTQALEGVVEDCVNSVGVDLNSASVSLLTYVAGLNESIAKNIVSARKEAPFRSREELKKVKGLGAKAFEQCAGFLRISDGKNILDNTAVHPESYAAAKALLALTGHGLEDVRDGKISNLRAEINALGAAKIAAQIGVGLPTLNDITAELLRPGRDIRDSLPQPTLRSDIMDIKSLKEGMVLTGTVRNVIDFGVFVDIGVHQDGLVHISQICDRYIKHPSEVLKVGDIVTVKVLGIDVSRGKISLTMKLDERKQSVSQSGTAHSDSGRRDFQNRGTQPQRKALTEEPDKNINNSLASQLAALKSKFK